MSFFNKPGAKRWSLGARALSEKLAKEFLLELTTACENFIEEEKRSTVEEEDVKIALIDLAKKLGDQRIQLSSAKFTHKELINSIRVLKDRMEKRIKEKA
ncbi:MAG: hypothetical protein H3C47_06610 [Candidatus Cloacimonetes bacterium]|nr:hypothetical protein [Candidatus Cloacimonadota bacterium]